MTKENESPSAVEKISNFKTAIETIANIYSMSQDKIALAKGAKVVWTDKGLGEPRSVPSASNSSIKEVWQSNVATITNQYNNTDSGVTYKFWLENGIVKYEQLTPKITDRSKGTGVIDSGGELVPVDSGVSNKSTIISYTQRRGRGRDPKRFGDFDLKNQEEAGIRFDMIAADGNRIFVKEEGKERFYFATLCDEFMCFNPDPSGEGRTVDVPGFYIKLDPTPEYDSEAFKSFASSSLATNSVRNNKRDNTLGWWPLVEAVDGEKVPEFNDHVTAWIFQFAKVMRMQGMSETMSVAFSQMMDSLDVNEFSVGTLETLLMSSPVPGVSLLMNLILTREDWEGIRAKISGAENTEDVKTIIFDIFEEKSNDFEAKLESLSNGASLETGSFLLDRLEAYFAYKKEMSKSSDGNPVSTAVELVEIVAAFFRSKNDMDNQLIRVEPGIWHEIDSRPPVNSINPPSSFPLRTDCVYQLIDENGERIKTYNRDVIAFNKVLSIGVGHEHRHIHYQGMYGGEFQAAPNKIIWSSINDRAGFWDGTCNFYMLVRLGEVGEKSNDYTILWADEQSYFSSRWRSIDPEDSNWDKFNCNTPSFFYWSPFKDGWINDDSRMAVSNQTIVLTGKKGNDYRIFSMNRSFGSSDLTWRWRKFPTSTVIDGSNDGSLDSDGFTNIQNSVNSQSIQIRADMTIFLKGNKNGVKGYWYQKYLPADNWECPTLFEIVSTGNLNQMPEVGYSMPWKFASKENFEKMCKYKYLGVYEHSVNCRTQSYLVRDTKNSLPSLDIDNDIRWFNKTKNGERYQLHISSIWNNFTKPLNPHPEGSTCFFNKYPSLRIVPRTTWRKGTRNGEKEDKLIAMHWDIRDDELSYFDNTDPQFDPKEVTVNLNQELNGPIKEVNVGYWNHNWEAPVVKKMVLKRTSVNDTETLQLTYESSRIRRPRSILSSDMNDLSNKLNSILLIGAQFVEGRASDMLEDTLKAAKKLLKNPFESFSSDGKSGEKYKGAIQSMCQEIAEAQKRAEEAFQYQNFDDSIWRMRIYAFDGDTPIRFFTKIVPEEFTQDSSTMFKFAHNISLGDNDVSNVEKMSTDGSWVSIGNKKNYELVDTYLKDSETCMAKGTNICFEGTTGYVSTPEDILFSSDHLVILFECGSNTITEEGRKSLEAFYEAMKSSGKIVVEGHASTDGSSKSNMELSERRASSVVDEIWRILQGPAPYVSNVTQEIVTNHYGERNPRSNSHEQNRRVEVFIEGSAMSNYPSNNNYPNNNDYPYGGTN